MTPLLARTVLLLLALVSGSQAVDPIDAQDLHQQGLPTTPTPGTSGSAGSPLPPWYNYCEAGKISSKTYQPVPGARLVHVQVATRHGDRTATSAVLPGDQETWDCTGSTEDISIATGSKRGIKGARIRYDLPQDHVFKDTLWKGSCLDGQLTPKGVKQHVALGEELRHTYVDKLKFLPSTYNEQQVHARATDRPRTRLSAIALMSALYPEKSRKDGDKVEIHVQPLEWDWMKGHEDKCPKVLELNKALDKQPQLVQHVQQGKALAQTLNPLLDTAQVKAFQTADLVPFQDVLITRTCHSKPLPCMQGTCVTPQMVKSVQEYVARYNAIKYMQLPESPQFLRLVYGPLIGEMRDSIVRAVTGKSQRKFELLSGHDTNLYGMLAILGMETDEFLWPPYASNFVMEVWQTGSAEQGQGQPHSAKFLHRRGATETQPADHANLDGYVVRIIYNGRPFKSTVCDFAHGCPLSQFLQLCQKVVPSDYAMECSVDGQRLNFRVPTAKLV